MDKQLSTEREVLLGDFIERQRKATVSLKERLAVLEGTLYSFIEVHNRGIEALEKRIAELESLMRELYEGLHKQISATSADLADVEEQVDGHAVLIRQLAARVGLSLYEQQRILDEPSNQPKHQHSSEDIANGDKI